MELKGNVHYVGVNDRNKTLFENLWPLPYGVSYNSYLIADDDAVVLVDTVDVAFFEVYLKKIRAVIGDRKIDYLIINHMEPDHSGSISLIKQYYPDIVLVGNKKTFDMVDGYYGVGGERKVVAEGDSLKVGRHDLHFYLIPMVHWPETMVTWCAEAGTLLQTAFSSRAMPLDASVHLTEAALIRISIPKSIWARCVVTTLIS